MSLIIGETAMSSDQSTHIARQVPGPPRGWEVSWLPGQVFDRNTAITAMSLADIAVTGDIRPGHRLWPVVESYPVGEQVPDRQHVLARVLECPDDAVADRAALGGEGGDRGQRPLAELAVGLVHGVGRNPSRALRVATRWPTATPD